MKPSHYLTEHQIQVLQSLRDKAPEEPYAPGYESQLYHPDVITQFPEFFNPAALPK